MNRGNDAFTDQLTETPFYVPPSGHASASASKPSVTSFLCTDDARDTFSQADAELATWTTATYLHDRAHGGAFTNQQVLNEARDLREWVNHLDNRGAPHRV